MKIEFRTAYMKDFAECWEVIDLARQQMISQGRHQWTNDYPSQQNITNDLNNGNAYVLTVDDKIAVYGALILNGEPQYEFLDGKWLTNGNYYVIHRLATHPMFQGKGLASIFLTKANSYCEMEKVPSIKIDTNYDNLPMITLLSKLGYSICGRVNYGNHGMRFAFEKKHLSQMRKA